MEWICEVKMQTEICEDHTIFNKNEKAEVEETETISAYSEEGGQEREKKGGEGTYCC